MTLPVDIFPNVMRALDNISQGHTLTAACDLANVSVTAFKKYVSNTSELHDLFNEAEQRGYDRMADALLTIDTDPVYGTTDPKKMKILSDNIKWYLSRKRPAQYGERVIVENNITADRAIIDALERGKQRAIQAAVINDVAYEVVQDVLLPTPKAKAVDPVQIDGLDPELRQFV